MADPDNLFPQTRWSLVCRISSREDAAGRDAVETLCKSYWYPLYTYARRFGLQESDAKDIVQEAFARLLANNRFAMADPARGRLRTFLLTVLKNVSQEERRKQQTLKRGGGVKILSLDMQDAEGRYLEEIEAKTFPAAPSLDQHFERQWAKAVIKSAICALRTEYHAKGKGKLFDALESALENGERWTQHAEAAAMLGMSEGALKTALSRLRDRLGKALVEEVRQTVLDDKEAQDEFKLLKAAFAT